VFVEVVGVVVAGEVRKSIVGDFRAIAGVFMVERLGVMRSCGW
jgi:hypothetical protein